MTEASPAGRNQPEPAGAALGGSGARRKLCQSGVRGGSRGQSSDQYVWSLVAQVPRDSSSEARDGGK